MLSALDFWLGRWEVRTVDGVIAGTNHVERALGGYAILEHWRDVAGAEGKSLFFFDHSVSTWRQVWVMEGQVKEKTLAAAEPGHVRFEGHALVGDARIPDRTTLRALTDGTVSQRIEHSRDAGATWVVSFDALYSPATS
jgi:hypothetical protein